MKNLLQSIFIFVLIFIFSSVFVGNNNIIILKDVLLVRTEIIGIYNSIRYKQSNNSQAQRAAEILFLTMCYHRDI
jgi:hypothetical protein